MIKKMITLFSIVFTTAIRAYWVAYGENHCGAGFGEHCRGCRHYHQCERTEEFWELLTKLSEDLIDTKKECKRIDNEQ